MHITTVHPPFDQRIFHRECHSLARAGYDTCLIVFGGNDATWDGIKLQSLGLPYSGRPGLRLLDRRRRTNQALKAALAKPANIYHIHDPELIGVAVHLKRRTRARVIYDCHEDNIGFALQRQHVPPYLRHLLALSIAWYEGWAARSLDAVVAADDGVASRFRKWGARVETLYNFPRLDLFPWPDSRPQPSFDLVYHGSVPRYHLEMCFAIDDALVRQGHCLRWLLLFGRVADREWAEAQVELRAVGDRFYLEGPVPHSAVHEKVLQARIGIIPLPDLPKFQHNIPTKLFEFMALGMPVVLSDLPPSRPFVGDGRCAFMVPADSPAAYAGAILHLLADPLLCRQMGDEGRRRVEGSYNWESQAMRLVKLYRDLGVCL